MIKTCLKISLFLIVFLLIWKPILAEETGSREPDSCQIKKLLAHASKGRPFGRISGKNLEKVFLEIGDVVMLEVKNKSNNREIKKWEIVREISTIPLNSETIIGEDRDTKKIEIVGYLETLEWRSQNRLVAKVIRAFTAIEPGDWVRSWDAD